MANTKQMKPLDLSRFEGATRGPWKYDQHTVYSDDGIQPHVAYTCEGETGYPLTDKDDVNGRLLAAAPQLLAELKALRAWREAVKDAQKDLQRDAPEHCRTGYAWQKFISAYNAAETELNDGKF
jgi:hypothetical protein